MMAPADRAKTIFLEAIEIESAPQRAAYLDAACADDAGLRREVEALLGHHEQLGAFLEGAAGEQLARDGDTPVPAAEATVAPGEGPGTVLGAYRLREQIGEGGMGLVFVAEQQHPVRRQVALKVIKPGMDTRQVIARFEAERQALALMDHPNIAKVHDGGETASGRPYFVMELVKGVPITEYCDQNQVPVRARLGLFLSVCEAVQHAHQKGIIHRDIKPSNVLVVSQDGTPAVKVIDFGVAKAIGQQLTDKAIYTQFAQWVGTPLYMSPEQAGQSSVDVDTRSDIYSLGVLLYELLTGTTPFEKERLKRADHDEIRRIIREEEPPRPSTRVQAATAVSTQRRSDAKQLSRLCRGDLDWIVMKALEKDRNRRYESASALAADVQRYLNDEPVSACPPSAWYRCRKFARRNKRILIPAGAILALLIATVVGLTIGILTLDAERQRTEQANANLEQANTNLEQANTNLEQANVKLEKEQARTQAALEEEARRRRQARQALDDMSSPIIGQWLAEQQGLHPEHRRFLEQALKSYEDFAADTGQEETARAGVAGAHLRVGELRHKLGERKRAEAAFQRARELYADLARECPAQAFYRSQLAVCHGNLGALFLETGRPGEAERAYAQAADIEKQLAAKFPLVREYRLLWASATGQLARVFEQTGRNNKADETFGQAVRTLQQLFAEFGKRPEDALELARSQHNYGVFLFQNGRRVEAEKTLRQCIELLVQLPNDMARNLEYRRSLANFHNSLGNLFKDTNRPDEAEREYQEALTIQKQLAAWFPAMPDLRQSLARGQMNLGVLLLDTHRPDKAEEAFVQAIALQQELAEDFPEVPAYRHELGMGWFNLGRLRLVTRQLAKAEEALRKARALYQELVDKSPKGQEYQRDLANCRSLLGVALGAGNRRQEAEAEYHEALALLKQLVADFPRVADYHNELAAVMVNLAGSLARRREFAAARRLLDDALPHHQKALGANGLNSTYRAFYCTNRMTLTMVLLDLKDHPAAADAAGQFLKARMYPGLDPVKAAALLAGCVRLAEEDEELPRAERHKLAQSYGDRAMAALKQGIAEGFRDAAQLRGAPDLEPLRDRKDFQELLAELEAKTQP
jgi:serine/threonine protein kinase